MKDKSNYGIVFLSWKAPKTLEVSLKAISPLLDKEEISERVIYFQEIDKVDIALAESYGFRAEGNYKNRGILQGMVSAVEHVKSDIVLYLECDCLLLEEEKAAAKCLQQASKALTRGEVDVMRLRHLQSPGIDYTAHKHLRYWPSLDQDDSYVKKTRRLLRPHKARRLIGEACLVHTHPELMYPNDIQNVNDKYYRMCSQVINWTNQSIMFRRDWFLHTLVPYAQKHPSSRTVNGFPDLEKELNCNWWRKNKFKVGWANPGLFTHKRLDRPLNDEKVTL